jgi:hypothetical protein
VLLCAVAALHPASNRPLHKCDDLGDPSKAVLAKLRHMPSNTDRCCVGIAVVAEALDCGVCDTARK